MKEITKSKEKRIICGVCGGISKYFGIPVAFIRLLFFACGLEGFGIIFYLACAASMPMES